MAALSAMQHLSLSSSKLSCHKRRCQLQHPGFSSLVFVPRKPISRVQAGRTLSVVSKRDSEPDVEEEDEEVQFEEEDEGPGLTTRQVQSMLSVICDETDVAEVELKIGSFELYVRRSLKPAAAAAAEAAAAAAAAAPAPAAAPAAPAPQPQHEVQHSQPSVLESIDLEEDETIVSITSPKVGILRLGKYFKGKPVGKAQLISVGDRVKKGQALAYVEQLGTFVPIEAPQAGEIREFVLEEGSPVAYNDIVIELAPFFGGHIIGDRKYA